MKRFVQICCAVGLLLSICSSLQAQAPPGFQPGDGLITTHFVDIAGGGGATDTEIGSTSEARDILNEIRGQAPGFTGDLFVASQGQTYNITSNSVFTSTELDFGGGAFPVNNAFPANDTTDFLIGYSGGIFLEAGTYTLGMDGDDGSVFVFDAPTQAGDPIINFFNETSTNGDTPGDNELMFEAPTGGSNVRAAFTVATDTVTTYDGVWYERGGGEFFELSLGQGDLTAGDPAPGNGYFLLQDGLFGGANNVLLHSEAFQPVPEPSAFVQGAIVLFLMIGVCVVRRRRLAQATE